MTLLTSPLKTTALGAALAATLAFGATAASAAAEKYVLDASHSQIVFSYNHLGYSTSYGMFSGFEGEIMLDAEDPAASSVTVSFPVTSMLTGWEGRFNHFMGDDFFGKADETVTFTSTAIEVTGEKTAKITGDLTLNGVTRPVELAVDFFGTETNPLDSSTRAGFEARGRIDRTEFGIDWNVPLASGGIMLGKDIDIVIDAQLVGPAAE